MKTGSAAWAAYGARGQTRREHLVELQDVYGFDVFTLEHRQHAIDRPVEVALLMDKGMVLAESLVADLRARKILLPPVGVIERVCAEALTRANRRIYNTLAGSLDVGHRERLDALLERKDNGSQTWLAWLRLPPGKPNSRHVLEHIDRLEKLRELRLPDGVDRLVHQNRLLKIAREGAHMTTGDLAKFETQRRYATMVALVMEAIATVTDEIIDLHDRVIIRLMAVAKLARLQAWHIRDETYAAALAELVNAQHQEPFAAHWGDGTTSSSDGNDSVLVAALKQPGMSTRNMGPSPDG